MSGVIEIGLRANSIQARNEFDKFLDKLRKTQAESEKLDKKMRETAVNSAKNLKKTSSEADKLNKAVKRTNTTLANFAGFAAVTVAFNKLKQVMGGVIEDFAELEDKMITVSRVAGNLSSGEIRQLTDDFRLLALETGISSSEIAKFAEAGARSGLKGPKQIGEFADTMSRFAAITGGASDSLLRDFSRIAVLTQKGEKDFGGIANAVTVLGNNFATTEALIAKTAQRLGQDLSQFEISTEFALGLATAMNAVGVAAERGGTAMGKLSNALVDAFVVGGDRFDKLAQLAGKTRQEFEDIVISNPSEGIIELAKNGASATGVLQLLGETGTRTRASFATLSANADVLTSAMDKASAAVKTNKDFLKQSEVQAESFKNLIKRATNAVEEMGIELGKAQSGAGVDFLKTIIEAGGAFTGLNKDSVELNEGIANLGRTTKTWVSILGEGVAALAEINVAVANLAGEKLGGGGGKSLLSAFSEYSPLGALVGKVAEGILVGEEERISEIKIANIKKEIEERKKLAKVTEAQKEFRKKLLGEKFVKGKGFVKIVDEQEIQKVDDLQKKLVKFTVEQATRFREAIEEAGQEVEEIRGEIEDEALGLNDNKDESIIADIIKQGSIQRQKLAEQEKIIQDNIKRLEAGGLDIDPALRSKLEELQYAIEKSEELTQEKLQKELDRLKDERDDLKDDLKDVNKDLRDLRVQANLEQDDVAAITSEIDAEKFIKGIEKSNKEDQKKFEEDKERHKELIEKQDDIRDAIKDNTKAINKVKNYSGTGG